MSKSKHTPEPWHVAGEIWVCQTREGKVNSQSFVAKLYQAACYGLNYAIARANAKRIVQCVNACAGMDDPELEIKAMRERIKELEGGNP